MEGHHHDHGGHAPQSFGAAFAIGIALNTAFVIGEVLIGLRADSMALVADGVHNFADVISLVLAWVGYWFQSRKPSGRFTYGYGAVSIQSAVTNAFLLVGGVTLIFWESIARLRHPEEVPGGTLMVVAGIHDLHVWPLSTNKTALSAHVEISGVGDTDALLHELSHELHEHFGIDHATIQTETAAGGCGHGCHAA
jgi:Co/Zn/Cd efflux system component